MPRNILAAIAALLLSAGVTGCKSSSDIAGEVCNKADTCGSLSGITPVQCKAVIDNSLKSTSSGAKTDVENAYNACLAMTDCTAFNTCINGVTQGSGVGTGGNSGTGGSSVGAGGSSLGAGGSSGGDGGSVTSTGGNDAGSVGGLGMGGSAGTGGSPATVELMTSGQNAYWMPGQVTKVTSGTADLTVDTNDHVPALGRHSVDASTRWDGTRSRSSALIRWRTR